MKENKYDDKEFFNEYKKMNRSVKGLEGAGEWESFRKMFPSLENKKVLDLGCGFGWHCKYCIDNKAKLVIGVDSSKRMLEKAKEINDDKNIEYIENGIEEINLQKEYFDLVISSLAFHYVENFEEVCKKIYDSIVPNGDFVFSIEHPIFTASGKQDWYYDEKGDKLHWPVDRYFSEGSRKAIFLGKEIVKYHKTLTTYINTLIKCGFEIKEIIEPIPSEKMLKECLDMKEELRRPMMLLISVRKVEKNYR
ncbi:class I SAM-dependent methyltransferase [uncultured Clostridium sp.]|uniref:class I SAM-dependent methyltransferase n=1 Tax=uncultured Clostridium sp. TaxID=59620 RepID=UPI00261D3799|nr:class I SAM-dependent methyltransferase [uncultured Clostridium sp.]